MKCPICGDEVRNGRCSFCGYRLTEADQKAREKYAEQKAAFEQGPPAKRDRAQRNAAPDRPSRPPSGKSGHSREPPVRSKPPERARRASDKRQPQRAGPKQPGKAGGKHVRKPDDSRDGSRPGRFRRFLFKLIVIGWALLYLFLIVQKLISDSDTGHDASFDPTQDYPITNSMIYIPTEGGT